MPQAIINILEPFLEFIEDNFETLLLLYIMGPFIYLIYYKCFKKKKRKKTSFKAKMKKFFSIPCMLVLAVPGFVLEMMEEGMMDSTYEEQWETAMCILGLLAIIYTIIQYGLPGIWLGPVRAAVGIMAGMLVAVIIIVIMGIILVMVVGGSDRNIMQILRDGEEVTIYLDSDESRNDNREVYHYYDGDETYIMKKSVHGFVFDRYGRSYPIVG